MLRILPLWFCARVPFLKLPQQPRCFKIPQHGYSQTPVTRANNSVVRDNTGRPRGLPQSQDAEAEEKERYANLLDANAGVLRISASEHRIAVRLVVPERTISDGDF